MPQITLQTKSAQNCSAPAICSKLPFKIVSADEYCLNIVIFAGCWKRKMRSHGDFIKLPEATYSNNSQHWLLICPNMTLRYIFCSRERNQQGLFLNNFILLHPSLKFLLIETLHITLIAANLIISHLWRISNMLI